MARPKFEPTAEQQNFVETMAAFGIPEEQIARNMGARGIDAKTLRKHFSQELEVGATRANAAVAKTLYRMATSGKQPAATMFWLKCRAGWRERPTAATSEAEISALSKDKPGGRKQSPQRDRSIGTGGAPEPLLRMPPHRSEIEDETGPEPLRGAA